MKPKSVVDDFLIFQSIRRHSVAARHCSRIVPKVLDGNNDKETTHGDAAQNDSAANRNTNTTALRIITDLPSYICILHIIA
jgi:hypothetical protein